MVNNTQQKTNSLIARHLSGSPNCVCMVTSFACLKSLIMTRCWAQVWTHHLPQDEQIRSRVSLIEAKILFNKILSVCASVCDAIFPLLFDLNKVFVFLQNWMSICNYDRLSFKTDSSILVFPFLFMFITLNFVLLFFKAWQPPVSQY